MKTEAVIAALTLAAGVTLTGCAATEPAPPAAVVVDGDAVRVDAPEGGWTAVHLVGGYSMNIAPGEPETLEAARVLSVTVHMRE